MNLSGVTSNVTGCLPSSDFLVKTYQLWNHKNELSLFPLEVQAVV